MRYLQIRLWIFTVVLAATTMAVGCASLTPKSSLNAKNPSAKTSLASKMPWAKKDAKPKPYPNPAKMAVTWTPDTLVQTGRTPTRGFGGRIYFYDEKAHAVPVEGTLVIHGFDEAAEDPTDRVKRFEFTPDQFTRHYSQSDLGASYSIWVPWDAVGGEQQRVSLIASFTSSAESTPPVQSVPSVVVLPGHKSKVQIAQSETVLSPQYTRWQAAASASTPSRKGLTTKTIPRRRAVENVAPGRDLLAEHEARFAAAGETPSVEITPTVRPTSTAVVPTGSWTPSK